MTIEKISVQVTIIQGSGLVAKDRNVFGKKTASDPYVELWAMGKQNAGKTATKCKTLAPVWDQTFPLEFRDVKTPPTVLLKIWDEDKLSSPDSMGTITISIPIDQNHVDTTVWYAVPPDSAKNASGKVQVRIQTSIHVSRALVRGNEFELATNLIRVGLAWDMVRGKEVDLDASCVAITHSGQVAMQDTVYYANTVNSNESVLHSGDEREGDEVGDDETITFLLDHIPSHVFAMYIVLTVATSNMGIPDIESTTMRVYDVPKNVTLCTFTPAQHALSRNSTAMFMVRIARAQPYSKQWVLSPIEDTHPTARDFGSLIPHIKSYTRDLVPSIQVDPTERVAMLRKGGNIRLTDYCKGNSLPNKATFGLAWDVTDGVNIDLDASAICLDLNLQLIDSIWFKHLNSKDGSIVHQGDEREGDEIGDDEKMDLYLDQVDPQIQYIGFVINSYSGQELDDVARASCHLFDPATNTDMASYALTDTHYLDGYTALVVACLYRGEALGEWNLCIVSEAAQGKVVKDNVDELQNYLKRHPPAAVPSMAEEEIEVGAEMPTHVPFNEEAEMDMSAPARYR